MIVHETDGFFTNQGLAYNQDFSSGQFKHAQKMMWLLT